MALATSSLWSSSTATITARRIVARPCSTSPSRTRTSPRRSSAPLSTSRAPAAFATASARSQNGLDSAACSIFVSSDRGPNRTSERAATAARPGRDGRLHGTPHRSWRGRDTPTVGAEPLVKQPRTDGVSALIDERDRRSDVGDGGAGFVDQAACAARTRRSTRSSGARAEASGTSSHRSRARFVACLSVGKGIQGFGRQARADPRVEGVRQVVRRLPVVRI